MSGKRLKYLLLIFGVVLVIWFISDSFSQPGPQDLAGDFKEVAFYRNENNTGPVVRIYAVTVADTLWQEMRQYGDFMPHTKYGTTKVYFFRKDNPVPEQLSPGQENFDPQFKKYCLGSYEKDAMSQVHFQKSPF